MYQRKKTTMLRMISALLVLIMLLPVHAGAANVESGEAAQPRDSSYLSRVSVGVTAAGSGKIKASFSVTGTGTMDALGVKTIMIEQSNDNVSWFWAKTYNSTDYPSFIAKNSDNHSGSVTYQGVAGRYYRAHITFYAKKGTAEETFLKSSSAKRAT